MATKLIFPVDNQIDYPAQVLFSVVKNPGVQTGKIDGSVDNIVTVAQPFLTGDSVTLYLPQGIELNDVANYTRGELGVAGALVEEGLKKGAGYAASALANDIKQSAGAVVDLLKKSAVSDDVKKMLITKIVSGNANSGVAAGVKSNIRVSTNPNYRTLFSDVPIRDFTFAFRMIPTSSYETTMIKNIITLFRKELYPTKILQSGNVSYGYNFPNTFRIRTFYNKQPIGHLYLDAYLTNVSTRYNGESMAFLSDFNPNTGEPTGKADFSDYEMTLTFTETRALDQADILKGY